MLGHGANGPNAQAMVSTEHDGQAPVFQFGVHGVMQQLVPLHHFGQVAKTVHRVLPRVHGAIDIAAIFDIHPKLGNGLRNTGHAQRSRAHAGTQCAGTDVGRHTNQADATGCERSRSVCSHAMAAGAAVLESGAAAVAGRIRLNKSLGLASSGIKDTACPTPKASAVSRIKRRAE
jgi:hypothetical protein